MGVITASIDVGLGQRGAFEAVHFEMLTSACRLSDYGNTNAISNDRREVSRYVVVMQARLSLYYTCKASKQANIQKYIIETIHPSSIIITVSDRRVGQKSVPKLIEIVHAP
jgi:hypothetical protein